MWPQSIAPGGEHGAEQGREARAVPDMTGRVHQRVVASDRRRQRGFVQRVALGNSELLT